MTASTASSSPFTSRLFKEIYLLFFFIPFHSFQATVHSLVKLMHVTYSETVFFSQFCDILQAQPIES